MPRPLFKFLPNHKTLTGFFVPVENFSLSIHSHSGTTTISGSRAKTWAAFFRKAMLQFHVMIFMRADLLDININYHDLIPITDRMVGYFEIFPSDSADLRR